MCNKNNDLKVREYINNYLSELQRHFDVSDKKMRNIIYEIYKESGSIPKFKRFIKKYISMVKSFYKNKIKRIKQCR